MEGLWSLLVLFGVVASIIQKLKKGQPSQGQNRPGPQRAGNSGSSRSSGNAGSPWRQMLPPDPFDPASWGAFFEQERKQAAPVVASVASAPPPSLPPQEFSHAIEGESLGWGSLSTEGMDLCDPSLGHTQPSIQTAESATPEPTPANAFSLSFAPDALVQGVIMSEILTRPAQRKRSWR